MADILLDPLMVKDTTGATVNPATEDTLDELKVLVDKLTVALRRLVDAATMPPYMDMSTYRSRVTAIIEAAQTLTTVTTVTGLSSVGTTALIQAQDMVYGPNWTAWALCCRERIS